MKEIFEKVKGIIKAHLQDTPNGKIPVIVLIGPTAVGKTALSIALAKEFNGEIISTDSRQVYKGMDIVTDKITKEEMQGVPHHGLDLVEPDEDFSAYDFKVYADQKIMDISKRGKVPFLVGGTMLYTDSVVKDFDFSGVEIDPVIRDKYRTYLKEKGKDALYELLIQKDPEAAKNIHKNNTHYVLSALEKCEAGANKHISPKQNNKQNDHYSILKIGLIRPREELYDRINQRVELGINSGEFEKEARFFIEKYGEGKRSITGLGYRQFIPYFKGEKSLQEITEDLKKEIRRFAKRQLSWWRKDAAITWVNVSDSKDSETDILTQK